MCSYQLLPFIHFIIKSETYNHLYLTQVTELPWAAMLSTHSAFIVSVPMMVEDPQMCSCM